MNKKGQSLITFVLFLPIIVLFIAFIIDVALSTLRKNKIDGIITTNMQIILESDIRDVNKIESVIKTNDDNIEVLARIDSDTLKIYVKDNNKSIYGKIVNNKEFNYCGSFVNKKINKKCG